MGKEYVAHSNAIGKDAARIIQKGVLKTVSDIVMQTAGPRGSTTMLTTADGRYPMYSKDGKKVLEHVDIFGEVERGILDQLIQIVNKIVKEVGDGTTSAIRLAYYIFVELMEMEKDGDFNNIYDIIEGFQKTTDLIIEDIRKHGKEFKEEDAYDICMISTNGNKELSQIIYDIYKQYGKNAYIELKTSSSEDYIIKTYDGLTLGEGYATPAFINRKNEICELRNPKIYVFRDPINTPELIGLFSKIVDNNIMTPFNNVRTVNMMKTGRVPADKKVIEKIEKNCEMIPTLILAPFISRDADQLMASLDQILYSFDTNDDTKLAKPPICIVTNLSAQLDELSDISTLCGIKPIYKYIDEEVQKKDIEAGKAATVDTVVDFCGTAEQVIIDKEKTKFINPANMFDENREYTSTYKSLVSFLKGQLKTSEENGESLTEINRIRRRLTGLTTAMVELYIGGISVTDRESLKDLADDAVRNCRSAAKDGVGRASNFEGLMSSATVSLTEAFTDTTRKFAALINRAYLKVVTELYNKSMTSYKACEELDKAIERGTPINLRTLKVDNDVLSSIESDVVILKAISKIVTIMFTSNQILISSAMKNDYKNYNSLEEDEEEKEPSTSS